MGGIVQATWYISRAVLGVLGIHLRNPYPLHRQKAFIVPGIVPKCARNLGIHRNVGRMGSDRDRFSLDWKKYTEATTRSDPFSNEGDGGP